MQFGRYATCYGFSSKFDPPLSLRHIAGNLVEVTPLVRRAIDLRFVYPLFSFASPLRSRAASLPQVDPAKQQFATKAWTSVRNGMGTNLQNRGFVIYFYIMAMMDTSMLQNGNYKYDVFPQISIKVLAYSVKYLLGGCSAERGETYTQRPAVEPPGVGPGAMPGMCKASKKEVRAEDTRGRHGLFPHPKVMDHVERRTIFRGAVFQTVI